MQKNESEANNEENTPEQNTTPSSKGSFHVTTKEDFSSIESPGPIVLY
jgi:hypothetical protein